MRKITDTLDDIVFSILWFFGFTIIYDDETVEPKLVRRKSIGH